ncbi:uncharacterized protein Aud_004018 [Aspergillus udagawae]|uniref:Uncharacterized protein n=1 Tax=Aspergillus udagawae TaxID=91492 RepID=A0A8E0QLT3_9EURO|nr:uncharacterized protein Aud_004018 [Aspergillus udagawae]GIC87632.1 hypothetical protein Aud_004018 [Aspergillus udagawae]
MKLPNSLYIIVPKSYDSFGGTDGVLIKNDDDEAQFSAIGSKETKWFILNVRHISGSSDQYHIYDGPHEKVLYSDYSDQLPTFESLDDVDTSDAKSKWIIKKKDETEFGQPICKVKNAGTGNTLGGDLLEFRLAGRYMSLLEAKRSLIVEDYASRMRQLLDSIAKSNATGIPLSEYVSRLAQVGLENLKDPRFTGLSR